MDPPVLLRGRLHGSAHAAFAEIRGTTHTFILDSVLCGVRAPVNNFRHRAVTAPRGYPILCCFNALTASPM